MKENMKAIILGLGALVALLALLVTKYEDSGPVLGGAPPGLALSTTTSLSYYTGEVSASSTAGILFPATKDCGSRVISTASSSIRIGISSTTPTAINGLFQAASTTAVYDGELYGCGMWQVFGFSPAGVQGGATPHTITILEIR